MPSEVKKHKEILQHFAELIKKEKDYASVIYPGSQGETLKTIIETLNSALERTDKNFKVLIIGNFNAGKSSMINALIGEELLPVGMRPETAVIGELHYGEEKRITLYPKKGQWPGGDEPFDLSENTPEEIARYVSLTADESVNTIERNEYHDEIEHFESSERITSKFDRMVIHWPLEILKSGVVLVDSPGLNDPSHNDYIVNGYMYQADAIVYLSPCTAAYSGVDSQELTDINKAGYRNIISGYTYYDMAIMAHKRKPPEVFEKFMQSLVEHMMRHTDLGRGSIHFLSNIEALDAKLDGDEKALLHSGFKGFEDFLSHYLVECRGRDQVRNIAATIITNSRKMIIASAAFDRASSTGINELKAKADDKRAQLDSLRIRSMECAKFFRIGLDNSIPEIRRSVEEFVYGLADKVDLEGFQPVTKLPTGPRRLWPFGEGGVRHLAKQLQAECQKETERRMTIELMSWCNSQLESRVKNVIQNTVESIKPGLLQIARDLQDIRADFSGVEASDVNGDLINTALGLAYALLTGDWINGTMSAVYGRGALFRAVGLEVGTAVAMGLLMGMGVAISFPVFIAGLLVADLAAVLMNNNEKQAAKIKTQAVSDLREFFKSDKGSEMRSAIVNNIMANITELFSNACDDMKTALQKDIKEEEDDLNRIIAESTKDAETQRRNMAARAESVKGLQEIESETRSICNEYGIDLTSLHANVS